MEHKGRIPGGHGDNGHVSVVGTPDPDVNVVVKSLEADVAVGAAVRGAILGDLGEMGAQREPVVDGLPLAHPVVVEGGLGQIVLGACALSTGAGRVAKRAAPVVPRPAVWSDLVGLYRMEGVTVERVDDGLGPRRGLDRHILLRDNERQVRVAVGRSSGPVPKGRTQGPGVVEVFVAGAAIGPRICDGIGCLLKLLLEERNVGSVPGSEEVVAMRAVSDFASVALDAVPRNHRRAVNAVDLVPRGLLRLIDGLEVPESKQVEVPLIGFGAEHLSDFEAGIEAARGALDGIISIAKGGEEGEDKDIGGEDEPGQGHAGLMGARNRRSRYVKGKKRLGEDG